MRGAENLALIGRAEQSDSARGVATSYACQNCCPDSFFDALTSCQEIEFFGERAQLLPSQRDRSCYGQVTDSYLVLDAVLWRSFDPSVVTVGQFDGLAEAVGVGQAPVRAEWDATSWFYSSFSGQCETSFSRALAAAACNVLAQDVQFLHAKLYSQQKDFLHNRVTLSASASGRVEEICGEGRDFQFTARFKLHEDAAAFSEARSSVKVFGEPPNTNEYVIRSWDFTDVNMSAKTGNVVVTLLRRSPRPDPEVIHQTIVITVAGDFGSGEFSVPGYVKITCP